MSPAHPNFSDFKFVSAGVYTLAGSITSFRLGLRWKKGHWWWDDSLALTSLVSMTMFVAGTPLIDQGPKESRKVQIFAYYFIVASYYNTIWAARLSILFTIVRIAPWPRQRKTLLWFSGSFVLQWILLVVQIFWVCEITYPQWKQNRGTICLLGKVVPICQVLTTLFSDLLLVVSPLWILRNVTLNHALRFRLVSVFCVSIATTVAAVGHSVLVITSPGAWEAIFAAVEVAVALTVCNASVVIPFFARRVSDSVTFQDDDRDHASRRGSKRRRGDSVKLSTLRIAEMGTTSVQLDVQTADETQDTNQTKNTVSLWDNKEHVGDDASHWQTSKN